MQLEVVDDDNDNCLFMVTRSNCIEQHVTPLCFAHVAYFLLKALRSTVRR